MCGGACVGVGVERGQIIVLIREHRICNPHSGMLTHNRTCYHSFNTLDTLHNLLSYLTDITHTHTSLI